MRKIILILIVISGVLSGCDKSEQILRKIYGSYELTTYTVDGMDSLALYKDSLSLRFQFYYHEENSTLVLLIEGNRNDGQYSSIVCRWTLINNNEVIKILTSVAIHEYTGTGPFGNNITPEWEILDLTKNEMKMKTTYNEKVYLIELKQI